MYQNSQHRQTPMYQNPNDYDRDRPLTGQNMYGRYPGEENINALNNSRRKPVVGWPNYGSFSQNLGNMGRPQSNLYGRSNQNSMSILNQATGNPYSPAPFASSSDPVYNPNTSNSNNGSQYNNPIQKPSSSMFGSFFSKGGVGFKKRKHSRHTKGSKVIRRTRRHSRSGSRKHRK